MNRKKRRFARLDQALDGSQVLARGYIRVSTEDQAINGISLEHQQERIVSYAKERGWRLDYIYRDEGASAWKELGENRRAFVEMIGEGKGGQFSVLICLDQSRFARDLRAQAHYINVLDEHGVDVVFLNEPTEQDRTQRDLVRGIMGAINEAESSLKSQLVAGNMREKAKRGLWIGSPPDGYDAAGTGGVLKSNARAPLVQNVFTWYLEDRSLERVGRRLIAADLRPLRAADWQRAVIRRYLKNPVYAGWIEWRGTRYRGAHEPLVDQETFDRVQRLLDKNTPRPKAKAGGGSLLVPWAHCGYCGCPLWISHGKKGQKYYFCSRNHGRITTSPCSHRAGQGRIFRVRDHVLEQPVLRDIMALSEKDIRAGIAQGNGEVLRKERRLRQSLEQLRGQLDQQRIRLQQVVGMKLAGELTSQEFNGLMADYRGEQSHLEEQEAALKRQLKEQPLTHADIERTVAVVRDFQRATAEARWDRPQIKRELERLLERVEVSRSQVLIRYKGRLLRARRVVLTMSGKKRQEKNGTETPRSPQAKKQ
ncbi:MAG: recombinase family protein [Acidobacteriota bacterium]